MMTVYHIVEEHEWGNQEIATVLDAERAWLYCSTRPGHRVLVEKLPEEIALQIAE